MARRWWTLDLRELRVDRRARMGSPGLSVPWPKILMVVVLWRRAFVALQP
jgi:hypothetical protein